jgi:hypothetical protein
MAEDAIALLDFIGWTARRDLHIVGTSLGGMIAQGKNTETCFMFRSTYRPKNLQPEYPIG